MGVRYETSMASVDWSSESGRGEKEYTYPTNPKDIIKALQEALDDCLEMSLKIRDFEAEQD